MYRIDDKKDMRTKLKDLEKKAKSIALDILEPTKNTLESIKTIIYGYIRANGLKIYGGMGLNIMLEKDGKEVIYGDYEQTLDVDVYSTDPINDGINIANLLFGAGYNFIQLRDAIHEETYKLYVETICFMDITYVPKNIYNNIPYRLIDGLHIVSPSWMMIDSLRVIINPLTGWYRLEKSVNRLSLMSENYPIAKNDQDFGIKIPDEMQKQAFSIIQNNIINSESCIVIGMYGVNYMIKEFDDNTYNYSYINYYEIISTSFKNDVKKIVDNLKNQFNERVRYQEMYPFFQYNDYSVNIYIDNICVCKIYSSGKNTIPYHTLPALDFNDNKINLLKGTIMVGSFALHLMFFLINIIKYKIVRDKMNINLQYIMINYIIDLRKKYFLKTNKTIYDEGIYQEFVLTYKGVTLNTYIEKQIRNEYKKTFSYNPNKHEKLVSKLITKYKNHSGNPINNQVNRKI